MRVSATPAGSSELRNFQHNEQKLIVHVGYPKAASSWLQNNFLSDERTGLMAPWAVPGMWGAPAKLAERWFIREKDENFAPAEARAAFQEGMAIAALPKC